MDILSLLGGLGGLGGATGESDTGTRGTPFSGHGGLLGFGAPEYLEGLAGHPTAGNWGRSSILSHDPRSRTYQEGDGDILRQVLSGYGDPTAMRQLTAEHRPGDVILSDQERNILADKNIQAAQNAANQWFADNQAPAQWIDYGITTGDSGIGTAGQPLGFIDIPSEWKDAYNTGLQATKDYNLANPSITGYDGTRFSSSPNYDPVRTFNTSLRTPEQFGGAEYSITNLINKGRSILDPSFVAPDRNQIDTYGMHAGAVRSALDALPQAMQQYRTGDQEAATRNQQAYDVLLNKGQEGGVIPEDYSKPFYGQITGQEGVGGQGNPQSQNSTWNGQSLGWGGYGGTGLGQSSMNPFGQQGGMQDRADSPTSGWGGVFGQKNPWSFA
jgi:hypothetical protein